MRNRRSGLSAVWKSSSQLRLSLIIGLTEYLFSSHPKCMVRKVPIFEASTCFLRNASFCHDHYDLFQCGCFQILFTTKKSLIQDWAVLHIKKGKNKIPKSHCKLKKKEGINKKEYQTKKVEGGVNFFIFLKNVLHKFLNGFTPCSFSQ